MLPTESYVTTQDGVRLFCRKLGDGPNAVIIPNAIYMFDDFQQLAHGRTLIFFDLRNRGNSDSVTDPQKLAGGIHQDVDDLEAVRRHFGLEKASVIGHSYLGMMVVLYAMNYPQHTGRVVQIGPAQPFAGKQYPAHLTGADATQAEVFARMGELQKERQSLSPREFCEKTWSLLRVLLVANAANAGRVARWGYCDLPNELNFMRHWVQNISPSIQKLNLQADELARVQAPVLTIHGRKDRNAPYGGGREWVLVLPNARLLTVENAAHVPWIEAPEPVFGAIHAFLDGAWPEAAQIVHALDPDEKPAGT